MGRRGRQERGAVAIVVAVTATMLFGLCALAVDLGSGFARKRDIQTQADLAVLAAAAELPYTGDATAIAAAARKYALHNEVMGQTNGDWNFTDADRSNGFLEFVGSDKVRLFAPHSTVDFWLAPVAGLPSEIDINAVAAAEIRSPGAALPFFVAQSCTSGSQIIVDPEPGNDDEAEGYEPNLSPASDPGANIDLVSVTPNEMATETPAPTPLPSVTIVAGGTNPMNQVTKVAFTSESDAENPDDQHFSVAISSMSPDKTQVQASVPAAVLASNEVWWVRVLDNNKLSSESLRLIVGDSDADEEACVGVESGNFGTLRLSRDDGSTGFEVLTENVKQGVQHDLAKYPTVPAPASCEGTTGAEMDDGDPDVGPALNCLETDPGNIAPIHKGLLGDADARLRASLNPTVSGCGTGDRTIASNQGDMTINNDLLSCFLPSDDSVSVGDVSDGLPGHEFAISADILDSPRFFYLPVLVSDPEGGFSGSYAVLGMLPAFLTEQEDDATFGQPGVVGENGVEMDGQPNNKLSRLRVRVIDPASMPEAAGIPASGTIPYIGSGTKVVKLVE